MKVSVFDAPVPALEWAMCQQDGYDVFTFSLIPSPNLSPDFLTPWGIVSPRYCTDPAQLSALLERKGIRLEDDFEDVEVPTPLDAVRSFLNQVVGEEIDVPPETLGLPWTPEDDE